MKIGFSIKALTVITILLVLPGFNNPAKNNNLNKQTKYGDDELKNNIRGIVVKDMDKNDINLSDYDGKVLLIVNVASKCGYTPQYEGLENIYEKYKDEGFKILAFPCNQFGGQEPGTNEEIKEFCSLNYGVKFKLFDKIDVNGENRSPLYAVLTESENVDTGDVGWNFEKFLIAKDGTIVARYRSKVTPESEELTSAIEAELAKDYEKNEIDK